MQLLPRLSDPSCHEECQRLISDTGLEFVWSIDINDTLIAYIVSKFSFQSQVAMNEAKVEKVRLEEAALAEMERELEIRLWIGGEIVQIGYRQKIVEMIG